MNVNWPCSDICPYKVHNCSQVEAQAETSFSIRRCRRCRFKLYLNLDTFKKDFFLKTKRSVEVDNGPISMVARALVVASSQAIVWLHLHSVKCQRVNI